MKDIKVRRRANGSRAAQEELYNEAAAGGAGAPRRSNEEEVVPVEEVVVVETEQQPRCGTKLRLSAWLLLIGLFVAAALALDSRSEAATSGTAEFGFEWPTAPETSAAVTLELLNPTSFSMTSEMIYLYRLQERDYYPVVKVLKRVVNYCVKPVPNSRSKKQIIGVNPARTTVEKEDDCAAMCMADKECGAYSWHLTKADNCQVWYNFEFSADSDPAYVGCYKDKPEARDLPVALNRGPIKSASCFEKARRQGLAYAAMQNQEDCFGGGGYGKYGKASASACKPC